MDVRPATVDDAAALQAAQARCPMGSQLVVSTVNAPDFFDRARAYEWFQVYAAVEDGQIVGSSACALRPALVNGEPCPVGYEFQYFTVPEARGRGVAGALHRHMECELEQRQAALSYLVVIEGNRPAMRLFESLGFCRHRTLAMPGLMIYRAMDLRPSGAAVRTAAPGDLEAVAAMLNDTWAAGQLHEPATAASLRQFVARTPAYSLDNLYLLEAGGELLAAAGCWDWSRITQLTVRALSPKLQLMALVLDAARPLRSMPRVPRPGHTLEQAVLTPVAFRAPEHLALLLGHVNNVCLAAGIEQLFTVAEHGHPVLAALKRIMHIDTALHLYVKPLRAGLVLDGRPVALDGRDL